MVYTADPWDVLLVPQKKAPGIALASYAQGPKKDRGCGASACCSQDKGKRGKVGNARVAAGANPAWRTIPLMS